MTIPLPCLVWIVYNASTNVELATLSNVSHSWREIVVQCIIRAVGEEEEEEEEEEEGRVLSALIPPPSVFCRLLLPSMIRYYLYQNSNRSHSSQEKYHKQQYKQQRQIEEEETYCVAWFHPDGIKFKQLPILEDDNNNDTLDCGERNQNTGGSMASKQSTSSPSRSVDVAHNRQNNDKTIVTISCVYQWNGYSAAIDVLKPFGYTPSFLTRVQQVSAVFYLI
jgi:hypothetical protein